MALGHIVTRGYGNGTLTGTIALVLTRGYTIGTSVIASALAENTVSGIPEERDLLGIVENRLATLIDEIRDVRIRR